MRRDIPKGAAVVIVALALVAGVVTGREPARVADAPLKAPAAPQAAPIPELDLKKLARERDGKEVQDIFSPPVKIAPVVQTPVAVAAEPPPPPAAPPLPFAYLGKMTRGGEVLVYLLRSDVLLLAREGDTLEETYRVESVSESAVHFVYLPLGTKQILNAGNP